MKLLAGLLAATHGYYSGVCTGGSDSAGPSPAGEYQKCKTTCAFDQVGRGQKIKFKWKAESENTLVAEAVVTGKPYHNKDDPYVGMLRFDKKFCARKILTAIGSQALAVDVFDKTNSNYLVEAAMHVQPETSSDKEAALVQFRRGAYVQGEYIFPKTKKDKIWFSMSGIAGSGLEYAKVRTCFQKATLLTMEDDEYENGYCDYTKCYLYNRYEQTIDWSEDDQTTYPGSTSKPTGTTPTGQPGTGNLIPDGVKCNGNSVSSKIVNGDDAAKNSWPWIVGVRMGGYMCGGTIINNNHVLTAAHCCEGFSASDIYVIVRDHNNNNVDGEQIRDATKVTNHHKYGENDGYNYNYDFCILETVDLNLDGDKADIACLPDKDQHVLPTYDGQKLKGSDCFVAGWGTLSSGGSMPSVLQSVRVDIFSESFCRSDSQYGNEFDGKSEFCAGKMAGGIDSCQGDSGGPLICIDANNQPVLYGVVSWGYGCASSGYPGIYGKVATVVNWIKNNAGGGGGTTSQSTNPTQSTGQTNSPNTSPGQTNSPATTNDPGTPEWETGTAHLPSGLTCTDPLSGVHDRKRRYAVEKTKKGDKIVGGTVVQRGTWPWIVSLGGCGGTIIHPEYVLTAAHCCEGRQPQHFDVKVGEWNKAQNDKGEFTVTPNKMWIHEKYGDVNGISYDVCLLKVPNLNSAQPDSCKTAVDGGPCWSPVCLPEMNAHAAPGRHCWVAGWGTTSSGGNISNKLRDVGINIMPGAYCESHGGYGNGGVNFESEFCAGIPDHDGDGEIDGGMDSCQGDSGGPVVCNDNGQPVLYGVVSWGIGCAGENYPGVYGKVSAFRNWIEAKMNE